MNFDPRLEKLVEAFKLFIGLVEADSYENNIKISGIKKAQSALKEASTPLKEFPVNSMCEKSGWLHMADIMNEAGFEPYEKICRQIAEGLEP